MKKIIILLTLILSISGFAYNYYPALEYSKRQELYEKYGDMTVVGIIIIKGHEKSIINEGALIIKSNRTNRYNIYTYLSDKEMYNFLYNEKYQIDFDKIEHEYWLLLKDFKLWLKDSNFIWLTKEEALKILKNN